MRSPPWSWPSFEGCHHMHNPARGRAQPLPNRDALLGEWRHEPRDPAAAPPGLRGREIPCRDRPPVHHPAAWQPPEVRQAQSDQARAAATARTYGAAWRKLRANFLKNYPACQTPGCTLPVIRGAPRLIKGGMLRPGSKRGRGERPHF
jgi:hypothetical protein